MDSQRNILLIAFVFVSFLLFQAWSTKDVEPTPQASVQQTQQDTSLPSDGNHNDSLDPLGSSEAPATTASQNLITVNTDVLTLSINPVGGDIVEAKLNQYNNTLDSKDPFILLKNQHDHTFIAQSGLVGPQGVDVSSSERPTYQVAQTEFNLADGQDSLVIPMTYTKDGIEYTKTFTLKRDNYAVDVSYDVKNNSGKTAQVGMYAHLRQNILDDGGNLAMPTYRGGAYSSEDTRYKKYSFDDMQEKGLNIQLKDGEGWAGMIQHYFASAWIPRQAPNTTIYSRTVGSNLADIGIRLPNIQVADGADGQIKATLWVGPKLQDQMAATAEHLELSVDYGWLWFIAKPLHMLLSFIHTIVGNWGFSIMMLTFIVRGAMYPLTRAQYTSMAKMRMLQPKIAAMRERLGDDRQRISQEMMEMYKKEKVNPLGGCLPIFLQMPIFIALYWSLMESVELRHAPFFGWIQDLSAQDPYYVLPLLMGVTMFFIQRMSPTTVTDPMQQKIMTFMPVMFTFFFLWFPSGLVLYWLVSNIVTLIQQTLIYKGLEKKGLHTKKS